MKTGKHTDPFAQARFKIRTAIGALLIAKEEIEALPEGGARDPSVISYTLEQAERYLTVAHTQTERKEETR
jgi:hypothetical protein